MSRAELKAKLNALSLELSLTVEAYPELSAEDRAELRALAQVLEAFEPSRPAIKPLTSAQSRVLTFVRDSIETHGYPPTRQEIADAMGFSSPTAAHEHLQRLARHGVITLIEGTSRGIRINKRGVGFGATSLSD